MEEYKQELMKEYPIDMCREELARGNFYHVNDMSETKEFSDKITSAILYHIEEKKMESQDYKSKLANIEEVLAVRRLLFDGNSEDHKQLNVLLNNIQEILNGTKP